MAGYRKLGRTADQRKALIRNQVTALLYNGKIVTTEAKAKEIRRVADGLIALAVKEKDNFETVTVTARVARKDKDGKRVKEVVDGKKQTVYDNVEKTIYKIKSTMCNCGSLTIPHFHENAKLTLVSSTSIVEGGYHDVMLRSTTTGNIQ
jgi:ribosomal protein L17